MASTGNQSFSYSKTNYDSFTGKVGGNDNGLITENGQQSYSFSALETPPPGGGLGLSSFSYRGGALACLSVHQVGAVGTTAYSHDESWQEQIGNFSMSGGQVAGAWDLANYARTFISNDNFNPPETVGPNTASSAVGLEQTTTGSGSAGTMTQISQGQFNYNGRQTSYGYPTPAPTTSPVTLAGPNLPFLNNATYNGSNWQRSPGNGQWTLPKSLTSLNNQLTMPKALAGIGLPPAAPAAPILFGGLLWSPPVLALRRAASASPMAVGSARKATTA